jgi:hypothetical protein
MVAGIIAVNGKIAIDAGDKTGIEAFTQHDQGCIRSMALRLMLKSSRPLP